jgi:hypothetical protein
VLRTNEVTKFSGLGINVELEIKQKEQPKQQLNEEASDDEALFYSAN